MDHINFNSTIQSGNYSEKPNISSSVETTTRTTTPELTTIVTTTLSEPGGISNSTTGARDDVDEDNGAVIAGAVCGAVVALALIILIIVIVHRRTKSRYKKGSINGKAPPAYDYAYGNCLEGSQNNLQSDEKSTDAKPQIDTDNKDSYSGTTAPALGISTKSADNIGYGQPQRDSSGYLLLEVPGQQTPHQAEEGDNYDYAYDDKHKRHSADDYVNARVSSTVVNENVGNDGQSAREYINARVISTVVNDSTGYSLAKDSGEQHEEHLTEDLYEIPDQLVKEQSGVVSEEPDKKQSEVPMQGYSLAHPLPVINIVSDSETGKRPETNIPVGYSLAEVPNKDNKLMPKRPEKKQANNSATKQGTNKTSSDTNEDLKDNHIYQNTQVKQMIAKLNDFNPVGVGAKQTDDSKNKGKKNVNRDDVSKTKSAHINRDLLKVDVPRIKSSSSETQLDVKSKSKPKKALLPPKHRIEKSSSTDNLNTKSSVS